MSDLTVVRTAASECMVTRKSDGQILICQHSSGFEGDLWQVGAVAALQNLSDSDRADFCSIAGLQPGIGLAEIADRFAETHLAALRMIVWHPDLAELIPAQLLQQLPSLGKSLEIQSVKLHTAQWVLQMAHGVSAALSRAQAKPVAVGKIVRVSDGRFTRYAVLETPIGDPIWISIARTGIVVKQSKTGLFGKKIFQGTPDQSAEKTQQLYEAFGNVQIPNVVNNLALRIWIQAAICMRDSTEFVQVLR